MTITWLITFKLGDLTEQQTAPSLSGKIMTSTALGPERMVPKNTNKVWLKIGQKSESESGQKADA